MLSIQNLTLRRGAKILLEGASLSAHVGDRIGLVGNNGTGKSSLLAAIRGEAPIDAGGIELPRSWRLVSVAQETPGLPDPAVDFVLQGDPQLWQLLHESRSATDEARIAALQIELQDADAYTARPRAERLLAGLGFKQSELGQSVASFSGGWRMRLNLARALMAPSEMLLLDEPTNHLDLDAIIWLERWLSQYPGLAIIISHDREFLDAAVKSIVHIEHARLNRYGGTYSMFEAARAERMSQQQAAYSRQQLHVAKLERFVERFKAKASKAKQAQSRVKMLERMERIAPVLAANPVAFEFEPPERTPDILLELDGVDCGYADKTILHGVRLTVRGGSRIGLLGMNGAGKSTLIKTIAREIAPLSGDLRPSKWLQIGYFAQHQLDMLDPEGSPLSHMRRLDPQAREQSLRDHLGTFHFRGEMVLATVGAFSGGEKARLALALIVYRRPNLLLLDEPTNHLDLETREALTAALAEYEGTLILVSHDRHLLRATADELWLVDGGRVVAFDGDLDEYRTWLTSERKATDERRSSAESAAPVSRADPREERRLAAQERTRLAELRKPLAARAARLERKMDEIQTRLTELNQRLADPGLYETADGAVIAQLTQDQAFTARELEQVESEWLQVQADMEAIQ
ncbi:ATP-binding cassette domain-containing protein [Piscinibacterium candidicorallinum]|uniref:ATP-binding cassette domain-containing protein n=1 Tax=Piscinibacterium candidicorallinum TaxID=1793872 RepID=A0ABV7GZA4_9BURK